MKKLLRLFMLAVLFLPLALNAQNSWTVANGTTTHSKVPLDFYNCDGSGNHRAQMLYPESMLTDVSGNTIIAITFYHQNTSANKTVSASPWYILMGTTSETSLENGFSTAVLDTVYAGNLVVSDGVFTFELNTPFVYNSGNLIVEISTTGATGNWFGASSQGCFGVDNVGSTYSSMSTPNYTAFLPKTTFHKTPSCFDVTGLTIDETLTTTNSQTLNWTDTINTGATYSVYAVSDNNYTLLQDFVSGNTYTVTNLDANTNYTYAVVSNCPNGDFSDMVFVTGRTACAALTTLPYTCGFEADELQGTTNVDRIPFCWNRYSTGTGSYTYYPYSNTSYVHNGSRALYFYTGTSTSYPDTQAVVLPELDVTVFPMSGNRITFWSRMSSTSYNAYVYVGTVSNPADFSTFTIVDSVLVSGNTHTMYSVPMTNATDPYVALMVLKSNGGYLTIDDVTLEEMPSCLEVSNLTVIDSLTTPNSITITWVDTQNPDGTTYTVYNMADTTNVNATIVNNVATIENLNANTNYTFGVQANCSSSDAPFVTVTGRTSCGSQTLPFSETFDASLSSDPCWRGATGVTAEEVLNGTALTLTANSQWTYSSSTSNGLDAGHYRVNIYGTSCKKWMITPEIDLTDATNPLLSFDAAFTVYTSTSNAPATGFEDNATQAFMILATSDNGQTWTTVSNISLTSIASSSYLPQYVNLSAFVGQTVRIAFYAQSTVSGGDNNLHVDNILIQESTGEICYPVSNLTVSDITTNSATLTWSGTTNNYTIYDMTDTTVVGTTSDSTYTIYNLLANTQYSFGVQANCATNDAPIVSISFFTNCEAFANPYTWDFENMTSGSTPQCWTKVGTGTSAVQSSTTNSHSGSMYLKFSGSTSNLIAMPETQNEISTLQLRFWTRPESFTSSSCGTFSVGYMTDVTDASTFVEIANYVYSDFSAYDEKTVTFAGAPIGARIAMRHNANSTAWYWYIDDVTIEDAPACLPITMLAANNVTASEATLSWAGSSDSYNVYVIANGDTTFVQNVTTDSINLTTLTAMTSYTYGVCAVCNGDESPIVTVTFSTACTALTLPYTETFETTSNAVGCWTVSGDGTWGIGVGDYSTSTGAYEGSYNAKITHNVTGNTTMLISPVLDGVQAGMTLDFAYVMRSWSGDIDELRVYSRSAADAAWQQVAEFTAEAATWTTQTVIIPGTVYQVAFEHTDNYGYGIGLDSVVFSAISGNFCYAVSNLVASNATASSVTLSWSDDNNSGATYTIYNMADNTVIATGVATTSYDVTGLTSLTGYTFGVVANCSATDESSVVTVDAVTACGGTTCNITIVGNDSYGDGWNGNAIDIIQNGATIATFTLTADSSLTETFTVCSEAPVTFSWVSGLYATETSFEIFDASDSSVYVGVGSNMTAGTFYTLNDACSATPPTPVDTLHVTVAINDATLGTITPTVGTYDLFLGDTIVFTATPNVDANFDGWRMIVGGQAIATLPLNPYSMVVNPNIMSLGELTVMAMFSDSTSAPDSMTVIVNTADPTMGTTDPAPGIHNYAVGEQSIITALPNPGYEFLYWIESATIAGMTMSDTIYNATVGLVVPPVYAGVTLNLTAYFQVAQGDPCDAPTGVTVSAFDDQSISLVWDDNTNAESWNIRYRSQNSDWTTVVANTNNYTITGLTQNTTYQMQVQSNCGDGNLSQWSVTVTQTTTGLNSYLENNISLYPNPANDYIDVRVDELNVTSMEVYDVYGKLINTVNVVNNPTRINVSGLATGMYFVRVTTEQGVVTKSFIKK